MHPNRPDSAIEVYKPLIYISCLLVEKKSVNIQPLRSRDSLIEKKKLSFQAGLVSSYLCKSLFFRWSHHFRASECFTLFQTFFIPIPIATRKSKFVLYDLSVCFCFVSRGLGSPKPTSLMYYNQQCSAQQVIRQNLQLFSTSINPKEQHSTFATMTRFCLKLFKNQRSLSQSKQVG